MEIKHMFEIAFVVIVLWCQDSKAENFVNIALGKPVTMSSTLYYNELWQAKRMVDGDTATDANPCNCCASTAVEDVNPWITIDLLQEYSVVKVVVRGRTDVTREFTNFQNLQIFAGNVTSTTIFSNNVQQNDTLVTATANRNIRTLTLKRPKGTTHRGQWLIVVCEVEIYTDISLCPDGYYGNCSQKCGHCLPAEQGKVPLCDKRSGTCLHGCERGYKGTKCTEACPDGFYGNCNQSCGRCLPGVLGEVPLCDKRSGTCVHGCERGYKGTKCDEDCNAGTYGNCSLVCGQCSSVLPCDHVTGQCHGVGCSKGYKGVRCDQFCDNGTYGSCYQTCGHCVSGLPCDHVTGECHTGCEPGYTGDRCIEGCDDGLYGLNCSQRCGECVLETACHKVTGKCPQGCDPGYTGDKCDEQSSCPVNTFGHSCNPCGHCTGKPCDQVSGQCPDGCVEGYEGLGCLSAISKSSSLDVAIIGGVVGTTIGVIITLAMLGVVFLIRKGTRRNQTYEEPRLSRREDDESQYATIQTTNLEGTENPTTR